MSDIMAITYEAVTPITPIASGQPNNFSDPASAFMVNTSGLIQIITARKDNVTLQVNAGVIYPIAFLAVISGAGTTATGIFALFANPQRQL